MIKYEIKGRFWCGLSGTGTVGHRTCTSTARSPLRVEEHHCQLAYVCVHCACGLLVSVLLSGAAIPAGRVTYLLCRAFLAGMTLLTWMRLIPAYFSAARIAGTSWILLLLHHVLASLHVTRRFNSQQQS